MDFTYEAYRGLIKRLKKGGYEFSYYSDWEEKKRPVILRHDIDYSIPKSVKLAELEHEMGVCSTFFVLVTSEFYNVFSMDSFEGLKQIAHLGHDIGLHFDEERYPDCGDDPQRVADHIVDEASLLEKSMGIPVKSVSMHRPSKGLLEADLAVPGMINSYSHVFFKEFKYLSDSRRRWREPVEEAIESGTYEKFHILTHAFWYNDAELDIHDTVFGFVNKGNKERYDALRSNITDLESIMSEEEVTGTDHGDF